MLVFVSDVTIHYTCVHVIVMQSCRELMHMQVMVAELTCNCCVQNTCKPIL